MSPLPDHSFRLCAPGFSLTADVGAERATIRLHGELDLATRPTFEQAVRGVLRVGPPTVLVDLGDLRFLAVAGAHAIEDADRRCRDAGGELLLTNPGRATRRLLGLFGLIALVVV